MPRQRLNLSEAGSFNADKGAVPERKKPAPTAGR